MRIVWIGFHEEGLVALRGLLEHGYPIEAVITLRPELAAKRSAAARYGPTCQQFGVRLYEIDNINDDLTLDLLQRLSLDLAFVIGWSQIVGPAAFKAVRLGMIGAHASLLPHNRGSAPVNWALIKGETQTGNSLIWLSEELDRGDIIDQTAIPISLYDTCASLYEQIAVSNRDMILRALPRLLTGELPRIVQPCTQEQMLPRRRPRDGLIDWTMDSKAVYDFVRALTRPYPGAFAWLGSKRWRVWQCALLSGVNTIKCQPGEVIGQAYSPVEAACGQIVACGHGAIILLEVEDEHGDVLCGTRLSDQEWTERSWTSGPTEQ